MKYRLENFKIGFIHEKKMYIVDSIFIPKCHVNLNISKWNGLISNVIRWIRIIIEKIITFF